MAHVCQVAVLEGDEKGEAKNGREEKKTRERFPLYWCRQIRISRNRTST